jgi:exonuclease VII small subunit
MSDTPISDSTPHNVADLGMQIRRLERQLNAANKLIEEIETSGVYDGRPIDKTYLTIHSDVLSTMVSEKAYDPQATKIRELQDRIKRMEAGDAALNYSIGLDLQKENDALKQRIKRLEEAGDEMAQGCVNSSRLAYHWCKAKDVKL